MDHIKNSSILPDSQFLPAINFQLAHPNLLSKISPWQLDFRQLEQGKMTTSITLRPGSLVTLMEIEMNRAVHQVGAAPVGTLNFGLPMQRHPYSWQGSEIRGPSVCSFGNGDEFDAECSTTFHAVTLSVQLEVIEQIANQIQIDIPDTLRRPAAIVEGEKTVGLSRLSLQAQKYLADGVRFNNSDQEELLIMLLAATCAGERHRDRSTFRTRACAVRKAIDYMEHNAGENLLISQVCTVAGVSWATLGRAFRERFQLGPKAYFNRMLLNRVRHELLSGGAGPLCTRQETLRKKKPGRSSTFTM